MWFLSSAQALGEEMPILEYAFRQKMTLMTASFSVPFL